MESAVPIATSAMDRVWHAEVAVHDGKIALALAGDGPTLVMLHGWTLDWRMWLPQVEALLGEFLLVMPDRRGFGRSTAPPDLDRETDDIERIADFLGVERYNLLGLSQGATVALDCARRHGGRVSSLIASGAPIPALVERTEDIDVERYRELAAAGEMAALRADWSTHELMRHENPETRDIVDRILADYDGRDLFVPSGLPGITKDALARLQMPLLALAGTGDSTWRRQCAKALADTAPRGEHVLIEEAGHLANLDKPDDFNGAVLNFLRKCSRPSG